MMKKGFTLMELVIVIIILGVLATLGMTHYGRMVERGRGAEAYAILGDCRKLAYSYWVQHGTLTGLSDSDVNIGPDSDQIPAYTDGCRSSHYWACWVGPETSDNTLDIGCYRCGSGGKPPQGDEACWINIMGDISVGSDTFHTDCDY